MIIARVFLFSLVICLCAWAGGDKAGNEKGNSDKGTKIINGTIVEVNAGALQVIVRGKEGLDTITLDKKTEFKHYSSTVDTSALKVGSVVSVHCQGKKGKITAQRIVVVDKKEQARYPGHPIPRKPPFQGGPFKDE